MDFSSLRKLLPYIDKELPAIESAGRDVGPAADAVISKDADVIGQGTSAAAPKDLPVQDADVLTQQAPQGPNQAALPGPPSITSKWQQLKDAAPYVGAAAAGTTAGLMSGGGSGNNTSMAAKATAPSPAKAAVEDDSDDEEDDAPVAKSAAKGAAPTAPTASAVPATSAKGSTPPDLTNPNLASVDKLRQLQDQMRQQLALNAGGRNMSDTVYAMSGKANPFDKGFDEQAKQAGLAPQQYVEQAAFQKQDPNSPVSKAYRDLASAIYPDLKVGDQTSAADLEKINPELGQIRTREDMIQMRKEAAKDRMQEQHFHNQLLANQMEERATAKQKAAEDKQQQMDTKRLDTYANKMALPSSRTVLGQAQNQIYSVDRVDALLNGHGSLDNITPQEMVETAKGLDRVISGGASTLEGSKSLDPGTAKEWIAAQLQKIRNTPQGAGGGAFLSRIQGNLQREKDVAIRQAAKQYQVLLSGSGDIAQRDEARFRDFLTKADVAPELQDFLISGKKPVTIQEQRNILNNSGVNATHAPGAPVGAPSAAPQGSDPKINAYAQQNNLDYAHAAAILKSRGYNGGQ